MLKEIRVNAKILKDQDFEENYLDQNFVLNSAQEAGSITELCVGGRDRKLTRSNAEEYISLTVRVLLNRASN
jgi:hypothetical protein